MDINRIQTLLIVTDVFVIDLVYYALEPVLKEKVHPDIKLVLIKAET